jgi:hypothetical protein
VRHAFRGISRHGRAQTHGLVIRMRKNSQKF